MRYFIIALVCLVLFVPVAQADPVNHTTYFTFNTLFSLPGVTLPGQGTFFAYLDVWTREVTYLEDSNLIDPAVGMMPYQARKVATALGIKGDLIAPAVRLLLGVYKTWWESDAALLEINPLCIVATSEGKQTLQAVDAKLSLDDNALYRHPDIQAMRDLAEEALLEIEASKFGLNYIKLDGSIACLVNGAGLAMATMDIIQHFGGQPANFLDVGGGASQDQVSAAFKIILQDPNVKGILVNIFGGIMDCNVIAMGIVAAVKETGLKLPLVVRLEGNNVAAGNKTLAESGLTIIRADSMADAAQKVVKAISLN